MFDDHLLAYTPRLLLTQVRMERTDVHAPSKYVHFTKRADLSDHREVAHTHSTAGRSVKRKLTLLDDLRTCKILRIETTRIRLIYRFLVWHPKIGILTFCQHTVLVRPRSTSRAQHVNTEHQSWDQGATWVFSEDTHGKNVKT